MLTPTISESNITVVNYNQMRVFSAERANCNASRIKTEVLLEELKTLE